MGAPARRSSPPPVPPSSPKPAGGRARSAGVRIPRMTRRGRPGGGPVRLFCARRPRPGPACRSSSSAAPHVRAAAVPGGPGRTDVDAVVDDDRDDHPRRSGCPRSCRPRRPPASPPPPGKSFRPTDPVPPPARPPHHVLDICGNRATAEGGGIACSAGRDWTKTFALLTIDSISVAHEDESL